MLPCCPGVVGQCEGSAACCRWVPVRPEIDERMRGGVVERVLSKLLETLLGGDLRVGEDAVNSLLPVHICGMFDRAAEAVFDRLGEEVQHVEYEHQHRQTGPI